MIRIHAIAALMVPGLLLAQTTTWTSFTDRRGHAMARAQNGQVVTFGGQATGATGALLEDTHQFTQSGGNSSWSALQDGPEARTEHAMAAAQVNGQPDFIVFGGVTTASATPTNGTFRYRGNGWHDVRPPIGSPVPPARLSHGMVNHLGSQTLLMFGGFDGNQALGDLWEFLPAIDTWQQRQPTGTGPSARSEHCMAYCAANQKVYVYGGTPFQGDLYEYDLALDSWQQKLPPGSVPPGRRKAAMAYVNGAGGIVMFGGLRFGTVLGDTWYYDPLANQWTQLAFTQPTPPARYDHAVAIDGTGNKLVLLGGTDNGSSRFESTWQFDSNTFEWAEILPAPTPRDGVAMAYDSARARHVVFGGRLAAGTLSTDETWEIDGINWRKAIPSARPPARSDAGLAYDGSRGVVVLHGGRAQTGSALADTWEWNGATWSLQTPGTSPPANGGNQIVYDSQRERVWLLEGSELWSFDGLTWVKVLRPAARASALHAVDAARNRLVIFGGFGDGSLALGDTWEWDGGTWAQRLTPPELEPRRVGGMAYHAATQECVMQGGHKQAQHMQHDDTWTWNGIAWLQRADLAPLAGQALAYDAARSRTVLFGGVEQVPGNVYHGETHEWDGSGWTLRNPAAFPSPRSNHAMAFDPVQQRVVLFGGSNQMGFHADTWIYDGANWVQLAPANAPGARADAHFTFDPASNRMVLFGGNNQPNMLNDTWTLSGSSWSMELPAKSPTGRASGVFVQFAGHPILWGGNDSSNYLFPDMWQWSGTDWVEMDSGPPPSRTNYGAAYDARRDRIVVFGGMSSNVRASATYANDTWEWDGVHWLRRQPTVSPSPRGWGRMTYDTGRSCVVLYGGADAANVFQDTWQWDGVNWMQPIPASVPPGSAGHDLTYDVARGLTVAFGAFGAWDYGPIHAASSTPYGSGCSTSSSNPAGAPLTILPKPWAGPWLGDRFEADFANQPANSLGIFLWGFSDQVSLFGPLPVNLGFLGSPSCNMLASAEVTEILLPGTTTYTSFLLPNHPSFLGAVMYGQAGFFDAGNGGLPVTSNGLRMVFGQK